MKRVTIGAAVAAATAFALVPTMSAGATPSAKASPATTHTVFEDAGAHAALVAAAKAASGSLVKDVGLTSDDSFTVKDVLRDADGATHVRVARSFKGIPVVGGDLVIHRNAAGKVTGHDGMFDKKLSIDTTPSLSKDAGQQKGLAAAKAHKAKDGGLVAPNAQGSALVIYVGENGNPQLAYQVKTTGLQNDKTPSRVKSFVNADTGAVLKTYDEIAHGAGNGIYDGKVSLSTTKSGSSYQLKNPSTGNYSTDAKNTKSDGTTFTDSDDNWGNGSNSDRASAAVDAQFGADKTFDYYKSVLGRNGIWNNGTGARSRVHYDSNYENAFWDGSQMTYGDGANNASPLTELDVAAHEMSHGVTENSAGLEYTGDAGGLNEATSDIFGTAVEWYANLDADKPDYLMGEKIDLNGDGTPLRYMDKPSKDGASYDCWSSAVSKADPHYSSGPLNHWYYLASEGSGAKTINGVNYNSPTCDSSKVTGAGHEKIEKIWYRALTTKLTSTATYKSAREAAITSAIELYGASGAECKAVEGAFNAINVPKGTAACSGGTTPTPDPTDPTPTDPTPAPGSNAVTNGDFEAGTQGWTGTDGPINDNTLRKAHGGSWKMWLGGNGSTATEYEQQTVTVPANGKLSFWMAVDTDESTTYSKYDTLKVQVVNGTTSTLATYSNLDKSNGYVNKTLDMSAYKGKKVTLKFLLNEDSVNQTSFVIDDIVLK